MKIQYKFLFLENLVLKFELINIYIIVLRPVRVCAHVCVCVRNSN